MKVVVAAGGTGGHLYPALALVEYIKKQDPNYKIFNFIGTKGIVWNLKLFPNLGYDYVGLNVKGLAGNPFGSASASYVTTLQRVQNAAPLPP